MTRIIYEIVEHDGGWAYKVGDVFSEPFPSHEAARRAAEHAAHGQVLPGEFDGHFIRGPRMAAGTKNGRQVPIGWRRMSRAEVGTDRRSSRPLTSGWSDLCRRRLYVPKRRAPSVPLRFSYGPELADSGLAAFETRTVERWCIAAAAPDPSSDERAAPSHTMMDRGSA